VKTLRREIELREYAIEALANEPPKDVSKIIIPPDATKAE
jgi:hypothetical protein